MTDGGMGKKVSRNCKRVGLRGRFAIKKHPHLS
jgi:hypothetical protein